MEEIIDLDGGNTGTDLTLSEQNRKDLLSISKWTKFLSIMGFIGIGLMVIAAFFVSQIPQRGFNRTPTEYLTIAYLVMAAIYFFPIFYLFKFSQNMKEGLDRSDQMSVTQAFSFMNRHYKYIGIFTIVIMSIYALVIVIAIITAGLN